MSLRAALLAFAAFIAFAGSTGAQAQAEPEVSDDPLSDARVTGGPVVAKEDAARVLELPLPSEPTARYAALQRQLSAANWFFDRARINELLRLLAEAGRGRPEGELWITRYLGSEFNYGSQGKAVEAAEAWLADGSLQLLTRAEVALSLAYYLGHAGGDRFRIERAWSNAESVWSQLQKAGPPPERLQMLRVQTRSEIERLRGDLNGAVASLREAGRIGKLAIQIETARAANPREQKVLDAIGRHDGSLGMLSYALVRVSRPQEAISIAEGRVAQWRAGVLSPTIGARWQYRLAASLVSVQRYEPGLVAARTSDGGGRAVIAAQVAQAGRGSVVAEAELRQQIAGTQRRLGDQHH